MRAVATVVVVLALAGPASAWNRLTPDVLDNIDKPKVLTTSSGAQLVAYFEDKTGSLKVVRNSTTVTVVSDYLSVAEPALVQLPNGTVLLYATGTTPGSGMQGILRFTSVDDGKTWTGPVRVGRSDLGEVTAAAVRPDGTPMFLNHYGALRIYQGLNGEVVHELSAGGCCTYAESLVVDSKGLAEVAAYSNANPPNSGFLYGVLDATGAFVGSWQNLSGGKDTTPHNDRVPLAVDGVGNTFVAWAEGSPSAKAIVVQTFRGGVPVHAVRLAGTFTGGDPHMALAVDASNRVWAVWTRRGALWAARSRSAGTHFGAAVRSPI
ncbi:MAG: sialidase family protein, partial [Gaiellaceae bacterium]